MKYEPYFDKSWHIRLLHYLYSEEFEKIIENVRYQVRYKEPLFPSMSQMFNAYKYTPYDKVKVVILGNEPYPGDKGNNGFAFSTLSNKTPVDLEIIFKEIRRSVPIKHYQNQDLFCCNDLIQWARQGVLLLNIRLSTGLVNNCHADFGWEKLTIKTIQQLNGTPGIIYFLWGNYAQTFKQYITDTAHIFTATHPATERFDDSSNFYNCNHFEEANKLLKAAKKQPINWLIVPNYCSSWEIYFNEEIVYYLPTYYNGLLNETFGPNMLKVANGTDANGAIAILKQGMAKLGVFSKPKKDEVFRNTRQSLHYHLSLIAGNIYNKVGFFKTHIEI